MAPSELGTKDSLEEVENRPPLRPQAFAHREQPLVTLTRRGMRNVLQRALDGRIPLPHVEPWAELIEGREDIGREVGGEAELNEALFELASPSLAGMTVGELVRKWVTMLA